MGLQQIELYVSFAQRLCQPRRQCSKLFLYLELASSSIEFFILVAREKDEYQTDEDKKANKPKVFIPDVVKGTPYEMNLSFHFGYDDTKKWYAEVTKTQGGLGTLFLLGKRLTKLPLRSIRLRQED
jgi:hypothetical protein